MFMYCHKDNYFYLIIHSNYNHKVYIDLLHLLKKKKKRLLTFSPFLFHDSYHFGTLAHYHW